MPLFTVATGSGAQCLTMTRLAPLFAIVALAAAPATAGTIVSLSPAQVEAAKEAGAAHNARDAALGVEPVQDRAIHGEVGFAIGTGGYRAVEGTMVAPLGDNGVVALSFASEQYSAGRYGRGAGRYRAR